jgi:DNA repair protein RecO (recombination protein O)
LVQPRANAPTVKSPAKPPRKDRALVLRRHPYSESSIVVSVLTEHHGVVQVLARGAHRPKSRYYAVLDYFHELELEWSPPKRGDLGSLIRGELVRRRRNIPQNLERYAGAMGLLELTFLGARPGEAEPVLFAQLSGALEQLGESRSTADVHRIRIEFDLAFLRQHGLAPSLETCASCGKAAPAAGKPSRVGFSAGAGGRVCPSCAADLRASTKRVGTLPLDVIEVAAKMMRQEAFSASAELLIRVRDFVERFLDYHLDTRPRSNREFLSAPNRNAPPSPVESNS